MVSDVTITYYVHNINNYTIFQNRRDLIAVRFS